MAAKATQVPIFMAMEHPDDGSCTLFKIETFHAGTAQERWHPLQLPYEAGRHEVWPPVIHHLHDHYSAILLPTPTSVTVQATLHDFFQQQEQSRLPDETPTVEEAADQPSQSTNSQQGAATPQDQLGRLAVDDSITTSQEEALEDYSQRATSHHQLLTEHMIAQHGGDRTEELEVFTAAPPLSPITSAQQLQLDASMATVTRDDLVEYARTRGNMSVEEARRCIWAARRREVSSQPVAQDERVTDLATASESSYVPSEGSSDGGNPSDTSMSTASDGEDGQLDATAVVEPTLRALVQAYFGDAKGAKLKHFLGTEAARDKLLRGPHDWTMFYRALPDATAKIGDLPPTFLNYWGRGMLAQCRLRFLQGTLDTMVASPEKAALQRWCDGVTRDQDPRRSHLLLRNPAQHALLLSAVPTDISIWLAYLFDERWAWTAGIMVIVADLGSPGGQTLASEAITSVMEGLDTMVSAAHWRHQAWELMKIRDTSAMTKLALQLMKLGREEGGIARRLADSDPRVGLVPATRN